MDIAEWLKNEEIQRHFRKASGVVVTTVYNEMYIYIWFICVYNIFLLILVAINLYLLVRIWRGGHTTKSFYGGGGGESEV